MSFAFSITRSNMFSVSYNVTLITNVTSMSELVNILTQLFDILETIVQESNLTLISVNRCGDGRNGK
jgi:hypothetical protein